MDSLDNDKESPILSDTLEKHYEDILKTAVAISIIRTKPQHMSGNVYAQVLSTNLKENEKHWKSKTHALEEELLSLKQEFIRAKLSMPIANGVDEEIASTSGEDTAADVNTMECLTPPCSSESTYDEPRPNSADNDHAKFLKSIVNVWNSPREAAMLKDTQFCIHLYTTVAQAIKVLSERIHDSFFAETTIPECCVDSLIGLLDMEIQSSPQTVEAVLSFTSEMIIAIMNHKICTSNNILDKYSKLILRLASHNRMTKLVLSKLAEQLTAFSNILRAISQEPKLLKESLEKYNSIYYVLWCIENILLKAKKDKSLHSISKSLMTTLEESVLHLSKTFPLFTCYVWRIGGLISATGVEEKMDVETT